MVNRSYGESVDHGGVRRVSGIEWIEFSLVALSKNSSRVCLYFWCFCG